MFTWQKYKRKFSSTQLGSVAVLIGSALFSFAIYASPVVNIELPLIVNGAYSGDINVSISTQKSMPIATATTSVRVDSFQLKALLKNFANDEQLQAWNLFELDTASSVSLDQLNETGLEISYDHNQLTLNATIPRLGIQQISMRGRQKPELERFHSQSKLASGLTVYARSQYNHLDSRGRSKGFDDTLVDIFGFTSIGGFGGWSLFYEGEFRDGDERSFERKDVTLVHDDYQRGLRYSVGDVRPTVSRFQTSADLLGISVERDYADINPFRNLRPSGRSSFTLERDSRVQFEVNGNIVDTQNLNSGSYSIDDFPLAIGTNDVRVWIDDGVSRIEAASFSTYVDTTLLAQGITNFGASLGVLRERGAGRRRYSDDLGLMGFYEEGVRENLTLGAQAELADNHALLSSGAIYGTRLGVIAFEAAVSKRDGDDTGMAGLFRYYYQGVTNSNWSVQSDFQARYRSDRFMSMSESLARPEERVFNARTSFGKNGLTISLGGEIRKVRDDSTRRISATLSKAFSAFSLSLGYQHIESHRGGDDSDDRIMLTVSKRFASSSVRGQFKSANREYRAEWRSKVSRNVGDYRSRVFGVSSDRADSAEMEVGYVGNRFEVDLRHTTTMNKLLDDADTSTTMLTAAGGVGYADGRLAYGRPFSDGFMIVERHSNLRGKKVFVSRNSIGGATVTGTNILSTMLVPLSSSYRSQRYLFAVEDLPVGYDLGSADVSLYPGNLAGFRFRLGSEAANTVIGKLLSPAGEPISLRSGKLVPLDSTSKSGDIMIFTNRTGRFVAEKMLFGKYRIVFGERDELSAELNVTEGQEPGLVLVGDIVLETSK